VRLIGRPLRPRRSASSTCLLARLRCLPPASSMPANPPRLATKPLSQQALRIRHRGARRLHPTRRHACRDSHLVFDVDCRWAGCLHQARGARGFGPGTAPDDRSRPRAPRRLPVDTRRLQQRPHTLRDRRRRPRPRVGSLLRLCSEHRLPPMDDRGLPGKIRGPVQSARRREDRIVVPANVPYRTGQRAFDRNALKPHPTLRVGGGGGTGRDGLAGGI